VSQMIMDMFRLS